MALASFLAVASPRAAEVVQQAHVTASNAENFDRFGEVIAISGDTMVVGAAYEASGASGVNGNQQDNSNSQSGAAYVFVRDGATWRQQAYLKASTPGWDKVFGWSVAHLGGHHCRRRAERTKQFDGREWRRNGS